MVSFTRPAAVRHVAAVVLLLAARACAWVGFHHPPLIRGARCAAGYKSSPCFPARPGACWMRLVCTSEPELDAATVPSAASLLRPGVPLEIWVDGSLRFGVFQGAVAGRRSLRVLLPPEEGAVGSAEGVAALVDAGQIVGVWRPHETRDLLPVTVAEFNSVREEAARLLRALPARSLELEGLWKAARGGGGGGKKKRNCAVTSIDSATHLFGPEAKRSKPVGAAGPNRRYVVSHRSDGGTNAGPAAEAPSQPSAHLPSCAERMAAAMVLAAETARFKRVPSERALEADDHIAKPPVAAAAAAAAASSAGRDDEEAPIHLTGGGFRALERSVVASREVASFCEAARAAEGAIKNAAAAKATKRKGGAEPENGQLSPLALLDSAHLLLVHGLELLALGGQPSDAGSDTLRALESLGHPATPEGARNALLAAGLWCRGDKPGSSSGDAFGSESGAKTGSAVVVQGEAAAAAIESSASAAASGDGSSDDGGGGVAGSGLVPWPADVLAAARELRARRLSSAEAAARTPVTPLSSAASLPLAASSALAASLKEGAGGSGRVDLRGARFGVYCVDVAGTRFLDDAVSFDPATGEVLVHVTDVASAVPEGSALDEVARLRCHTEYLPTGPLFMLPPPALDALSFSSRLPNEALTVALRLDDRTGAVLSSRVFRSLLPPARLLTYELASRHLGGSLSESSGSDADCELYGERAELQALERFTLLSATARSLASLAAAEKSNTLSLQQRQQRQQQQQRLAPTPAHAVVDELLILYSSALVKFCKAAGAPTPALAGLAKRVEAGRTRFATGPLRRYIDLMAQRQAVVAVIRQALLSGKRSSGASKEAGRRGSKAADGRGGGSAAAASAERAKLPAYIGKKQLAETVTYLTWRANRTRASATERTKGASFEALAAHCARLVRATGLPHAVLEARATGRGREVVLAGGIRVRLRPRRRSPKSSPEQQQQQQQWRTGEERSGAGGVNGGSASRIAAFRAGQVVKAAVLSVDAARQEAVAEEIC